MIGWTPTPDREGDLSPQELPTTWDLFLQILVSSCAVIAGCLVIIGALFASEQDTLTRLGAGLVGVLTIICGGLMALKEGD